MMARFSLIAVSLVAGSLLVPGCSNPADDSTAAVVGAPVAVPEPAAATDPAAPAAVDAAPALAILPASSTINFVGSKVTGSHEGGFKTFNGSITLTPDGKQVAGVQAEIDMNSTWSDNENLTGHLKAPDFFDVATHPSARFVSTAIAAGGEKGASHTITGNFTLHGVTRSIQFPATLAVADGAATLTSDFFINRKDFGIVYPGKPDDLIRDEVVIKLALQAGKTP
jgi:polyisoprenoid-binding protein YceI